MKYNGLAPDRDRIRAHLRIIHSDFMKNYSVTYEQFNNGVKRLSCDETVTIDQASLYAEYLGIDTVVAISQFRKHGYRLNAVGMSRYTKALY